MTSVTREPVHSLFGSPSSVYSELDGRVEPGRGGEGVPYPWCKLRGGTRIITTLSISQKQKYKAWFIKAKFKARMERRIIGC